MRATPPSARIMRARARGHDGDGAGFFGDAGLLDVHDIHDDAAFEHFCETDFQAQA